MEKKQYFTGIIIGLLIGGSLGYFAGEFHGLNWCVEQGFKILKINNLEPNIDSKLVTAGIQIYEKRATDLIGNWSEIVCTPM